MSVTQVFNYLFGSLTRIYTTLQEVDDRLILYGFVGGFLLNVVLAAQMVSFRKIDPRTRTICARKQTLTKYSSTTGIVQQQLRTQESLTGNQRTSLWAPAQGSRQKGRDPAAEDSKPTTAINQSYYLVNMISNLHHPRHDILRHSASTQLQSHTFRHPRLQQLMHPPSPPSPNNAPHISPRRGHRRHCSPPQCYRSNSPNPSHISSMRQSACCTPCLISDPYISFLNSDSDLDLDLTQGKQLHSGFPPHFSSLLSPRLRQQPPRSSMPQVEKLV